MISKYKNDMITVVTLFWQDPTRDKIRSYKFNMNHVRILRNMVARNLTIPHEFVCVTNVQTAMDELPKDNIRCVPLDPSKHVPGTVFQRLMLRHPNIGGILGRRIFMLDLDVVIVRNFDSIVDRPEDAVFWRNPNYTEGGRRAFYQSSIQLFDAGARSFLHTEFDPRITPSWVNRRFGAAEQAWFSERLSWDEAHWTSADGIYGAGRLGDTAAGVDGTNLPENAKIVSFPGNRLPDDDNMLAVHPWVADHYK